MLFLEFIFHFALKGFCFLIIFTEVKGSDFTPPNELNVLRIADSSTSIEISLRAGYMSTIAVTPDCLVRIAFITCLQML